MLFGRRKQSSEVPEGAIVEQDGGHLASFDSEVGRRIIAAVREGAAIGFQEGERWTIAYDMADQAVPLDEHLQRDSNEWAKVARQNFDALTNAPGGQNGL